MHIDKIDRRVRRTRDRAQRALLSLIVEKGYDAIKVTDIIERADIGRSTFYHHFPDKREVLCSCLDGLAEVLRTHRIRRPGEMFAFSLPMFEHLSREQELLRALLGRRGGAYTRACVEKFLATVVRDELVAHTPDPARPPANLDLLVTGVVGVYLALIMRYADAGSSYSPHDMDATFRALVAPGIGPALSVH